MASEKPNEEEVWATTLPGSRPFDGWYCPNHPPDDNLANSKTRSHCWGCGVPKAEGGRPGSVIVAVTTDDTDRVLRLADAADLTLGEACEAVATTMPDPDAN